MIPDWLMVTVCPATVRVPVRAAVLAFAVAEKLTEPLPNPVAPFVIPSHPLLLEAVQSQAGAAAVTVTMPAAWDEPSTVSPEVTLKLHVTPAWLTWNGWPPITSEPVRPVMLEFAATEKLTVPAGPFPEPPEVTEIQLGGSAVV